LNGNSTASWSDPQLTVNGIAQAQVAHDFWQQLIDQQKIHTPDLFYVSPLTRCLQTIATTFDGLRWPSRAVAARYAPVVLEKLRENISIHTCDRRSNKTVIERTFPAYRIEPGFTECDELWNGVTAETSSSENARSLAVLNQLWDGTVFGPDTTTKGTSLHDKEEEENLFISITSHSGEIGSLLSVLGHRSFSLSTGAVIPVLVKAETVTPPPTPTSTQPWQVSPHCTVPPVASNSVCLCPASAAPVTTPLVPTGGCQ
jgi:phosphohistidine phosphatase SixA